MPVRIHLCLSPETIESEFGLLDTVRNAGVTDIWIAGFLYGHWYFSLGRIQNALQAVEAAGMAAHVVNLPLGHPGDSLGAGTESVPLGPPAHWRMGLSADRTLHSGTSLHVPAVSENCNALTQLHSIGVDAVFLDDDFRLASAPGIIGGCFCDEHRERFLEQYALGLNDWQQLLEDIANRTFSPLLRTWVDFNCNELTEAFRQQQQAATGVDLGIMVMYLGSEKAGIRLADFADVPMRVGEFMFYDAVFGQPKGKTDELFSVLFHRRFCSPERSYSESTAFPADQLSAQNLAAKLVTALIADVRNVMLMSGLSPFPRQHWPTLANAIQRNASLHSLIAGCRLRGPFKHFWGEASRYVGDDQPYSLFLALGIPFEIVDEPQVGWNFLSKADARELQASGVSDPRVTLVYRPEDCPGFVMGNPIEETLDALFAFKRQVLPLLQDVPCILENTPAVCAWYPEVNRVLVWNLCEQATNLTLRYKTHSDTLHMNGLDVRIVQLT